MGFHIKKSQDPTRFHRVIEFEDFPAIPTFGGFVSLNVKHTIHCGGGDCGE
jgi:hypothetical protein